MHGLSGRALTYGAQDPESKPKYSKKPTKPKLNLSYTCANSFLFIFPEAIQHNNYSHNICSVLGIISIMSNLKDVCRLYANTMAFDIRNFSTSRFWSLRRSGTNPLRLPRGNYNPIMRAPPSQRPHFLIPSPWI
jgi:hypothetical protein